MNVPQDEMSILVCVPMEEIMDTPGIFDALRGEETRWTKRLRSMLAARGLDTSDDAQVYHLRCTLDCHEWWFCNASSPRGAHEVLYGEMQRRFETRMALDVVEKSEEAR